MKYILLLLFTLLFSCSSPDKSYTGIDTANNSNQDIVNQPKPDTDCYIVGSQKDCTISITTSTGYVSCWKLKIVCKSNNKWGKCGETF